MKKVLIIGVVGLVAIVALVVVGLVAGIGSAVKAAVESLGSRATQSQVTLADADISLTSGAGSLKGLKIGNPKGFEMPSAFELGEIRIQLDTGSLSSDTIVIKEILIDSPEVTYELSGTGSNMGAIEENVKAFAGGDGAAEETPEEPADAPAEDGGGKKFIIENLIIKGGRVNVSATLLKGKSAGADLPGVHLKDIGKNGPISAEQLTAEILNALTNVTDRAVDQLDIGAKGLLDKAGDALGGLFGGDDDEKKK